MGPVSNMLSDDTELREDHENAAEHRDAPHIKNKILVLGCPKTGKHRLIQKLSAHVSGNASSSSDANTFTITTTSTPSTHPLTLTTRYYTASVVLWVDTLHDGDAETPDQDMQRWCDIGKEAVDGFIFVYDRNRPDTFEPVRKWTRFLEEVEPGVVLCIANDATTSTDGDSATTIGRGGTEDREEHEAFCVENGLEYVDMCDLEGTLSVEERDRDEGEDGEGDASEAFAPRVGIPRILEALEANAWDGLVLVDKGAGSTVGEIPSMHAGPGVDAAVPPSSRSDPPSFSAEALLASLQGLAMESDEDGDEDDGFFERTFRAFKGLREHGSTLPDDERRALAARVALSLGMDSEDEEEMAKS
ncbi:hypothetical protein HKX48_003768 [Thoreauomyces humboldtii]|nr:hypothetical protein HKX48_003768 [Thoreauomyces humboldtii]